MLNDNRREGSQSVLKYWLVFFVLVLSIVVILLFYLDWQASNRKLTFAVFDVGQGDAIFIESPTGTQILIDAGPPKKVMSELARVMPFFDRTIDAVIVTNPDADHIAGFLDVLKVYKVSTVFEAGTFNESKTYQNLKEEIQNKNITNTLAKKDMRIDLGGGVFLDILFPDRDVSSWTTNDGSVVARLAYGDTTIMLTGDATEETEKIILQEYSAEFLDSDILKVAHHGSKTSSLPEFLKAVSPAYAIISDGKNNKYGHPHKVTLDSLEAVGADVLRTDQLGTIIFSCDRIGECKPK